ncbi:hypothetical protein G6F32_013518 [Rhizopus arrhizus]|nr:hypothetical protein G6F32_013518 [Rhizopus arrhizus]
MCLVGYRVFPWISSTLPRCPGRAESRARWPCLARPPFHSLLFVAMTLTFNGRAFAALLAVTALLALIALYGAPYPFLRGFVGDVVAVGWVYLVYRTFIRASVGVLAVAALLLHESVSAGMVLRGHIVACGQRYWPVPPPVVEAVRMQPVSRISFEGQVGLVTGAAGGLGLAYSRLLAERGTHVVMHDVGAGTNGRGTDPLRIQHSADAICCSSMATSTS